MKTNFALLTTIVVVPLFNRKSNSNIINKEEGYICQGQEGSH